jgi:hypothetical protein
VKPVKRGSPHRENIKLGFNAMVVTNALDYNAAVVIATVKKFYNTNPWIPGAEVI